jgi:predicted nucleotidyltransferase
MNHADSDVDRKGIFLHDLPSLYGIRAPAETYTQHDPDVEVHEIAKYLRLTLQCNPNLLELLFLPADCVEFETYAWVELRRNRDRFLSERAVRSSYGGYAKQQLVRLQSRLAEGKEGFSSDVKQRTSKHARHIFRLFWQGQQLLLRGEMDVRMTKNQRDLLFWLGEQPVETIIAEFEAEDQMFQDTLSVLPDAPDEAWVNDFLIDLRFGRVSSYKSE